AEDGIRDLIVTGVQTCALPIWKFQGGEPPHEIFRAGLKGGASPSSFSRAGAHLRSTAPFPSELQSRIPSREKIRNAGSPSRGLRSEERRVGKESRRRGGRRSVK